MRPLPSSNGGGLCDQREHGLACRLEIERNSKLHGHDRTEGQRDQHGAELAGVDVASHFSFTLTSAGGLFDPRDRFSHDPGEALCKAR